MDNSYVLMPHQAAARAGVTTQTLLRWVKEGYGPRSIGSGRNRRYPSDDFEKWLAEREAANAAS